MFRGYTFSGTRARAFDDLLAASTSQSRTFRRAHELDPDLSAAACDLAGALATLGQTQEALAVLAGYRARHPEDGVAAGLERAIRADAATSRGNS